MTTGFTDPDCVRRVPDFAKLRFRFLQAKLIAWQKNKNRQLYWLWKTGVCGVDIRVARRARPVARWFSILP